MNNDGDVGCVGELRVRHQCKENDNCILLCLVDGELDEIQVGDVLQETQVIIGVKDLEAALKSVGYRVTREVSG